MAGDVVMSASSTATTRTEREENGGKERERGEMEGVQEIEKLGG
jgi:hypothetical protein